MNRESFMQIKAIKVLQLWVMWNNLKKMNQWDFYCPKMAPATIKKLVIIDNMCSLLLSMTYNGWYTQTTSLSWALACRIIFIWNLCVSKVRGSTTHTEPSPLSNLYPLFLSMTQHESLPLSFLAIWPNFKHIPLKRVKTLNGTLSQDGPACTWDRLMVCRCAASPWNSDVSAGLRLHNKDIPETNQKRLLSSGFVTTLTNWFDCTSQRCY